MSKNQHSKIHSRCWCPYQRHYYIVLFLTFLLFSFIPKHAMHLSITEMDFKTKGEKTEIQISHKIFIDDLENALRKNYSEVFKNSKPNISTTTQHKEAEKYIYNYLKKSVDLKVNSKKEEINYIGLEFEDDVIWVYGSIEKSTSIEKESIFIKNMILMDLFDDQRNMLYLTKEKTKEFLNFTNDERTQRIQF
ncbi:DUF6702 family protein [Bernardetia sp. OM2101]|uniref:DUF6702 family protein n=1 Tax=Bernardetia sp. OM2101 TaxID=3344876 RepID=UPI0035CF1927